MSFRMGQVEGETRIIGGWGTTEKVMPKQEFIRNVQLARNLFAHRVGAGQPVVNEEEMSRRLSRAALWLTPASVRGFDAADFPELPDETRGLLERSVHQFRKIAAAVEENEPATAEQEGAALRNFEEIIRILHPYSPNTGELDQLRAVMSAIHLPDFVQTWDYEFGLDWSGDPAVWIWLVVDDDAANHPSFMTTSTRLQREIHRALKATGSERWPYVRFRTFSEQRELQAVGA